MTLRSYQQQLINDVEAAWAAGSPNVIGVLPTGAGKTMTMSAIAAAHANEAGVAIAHRSVLIGQISMALARAGVPHDIVASKPVVRTIVSEHMEELGRSLYVPGHKWKVASVDTLPGRAAALAAWMRQVTIGFTDECFPAGTLVDGRPIETIAVGDMVTAFDSATGNFEQREVKRLFKNPMPPELRMVVVGHHVLKCTNGHPFWTRRGWVQAAELTTDDWVLCDEMYNLREPRGGCDGTRAVSLQEDWPSVLPAQLRLRAPGGHTACATDQEDGAMQVRNLWAGIRRKWMEIAQQVPHLFREMFHCGPCQGFVGDCIGDQSKVRIGSHEGQQPDAQRSHARQDEAYPKGDRSRANGSRRERSWSNGGRAGSFIHAVAVRVRGAVHRAYLRLSESAAALQIGLGAAGRPHSGGSGRSLALRDGPQGTRPQERGVFTWRRVDSVSVYKPTSVDGPYIHNIEVDSLHTYVAGGVVVHNCHHVLEDNKWGRACLQFDNPAMRWFLPTATPERGDRKGLGRHADGIADALIEGPSMRWHIDNGYLTDYIIRAPMPADLDLTDVDVSASGEYNQKQLRRAVHRSTKIIGNIVDTYLTHTPSKLGIAFAVDIEHGTQLTAEFNSKGVPCELITAEHSEEERRAILRRYRERKTLVLVNVDLFGEGFDLPAIEVVMFGRPTASYSLFAQQFGRGLRLMIEKSFMAMWESYSPEQRKAIIRQSGKPVAYIHDHVGNVLHFYGPPDKPREWSLDRKAASRSGPSDTIPLRVCTNTSCLQPYERFYPRCPYCGMEPPQPIAPSSPKEVDGDLTLYTPEMLRAMFNVETVEDALAIGPNEFCAIPPGVPQAAVAAIQKRHHEKLREQGRLREMMTVVMPPSLEPRVAQRKFYLRYGVDVVQAKLLGAKETAELNERLITSIRAAVDKAS